MDLLKLMEERYSVRSFSDRKVEEEKIEAILRAAQVAPTACNNQPQKIIRITSDEGLEKWKKCSVCHFNPQLVFVICCDRTKAWKRAYDGQDSVFVDGAILTTHMMLEGWEQGVGSTWIMHFDPAAVREEFHLPEDVIPVSALVMGYPAEGTVPNPRHSQYRELNETVVYETF